jgi:hypothetical protein
VRRQIHAIPRLRRWGLLRLSRNFRPEDGGYFVCPETSASRRWGLLRLSRNFRPETSLSRNFPRNFPKLPVPKLPVPKLPVPKLPPKLPRPETSLSPGRRHQAVTDHRSDESSTGYSFTSSSPAELMSASPALQSFSLNLAAVKSSAANHNCPSNSLSQPRGPLHHVPLSR